MGKKIFIQKYCEVLLPENKISQRIATFERLGHSQKILKDNMITVNRHRFREEEDIVDRLTLSPRNRHRTLKSSREFNSCESIPQSDNSAIDFIPSPRIRSSVHIKRCNSSPSQGKNVLQRSPSLPPTPSPRVQSQNTSFRQTSLSKTNSLRNLERRIQDPYLEETYESYVCEGNSTTPGHIVKRVKTVSTMNDTNSVERVVNETVFNTCHDYKRGCTLDWDLKHRSTNVKNLANYYEDKRQESSIVSETKFKTPLFINTGYKIMPPDALYRTSSTILSSGDCESNYSTEDTNSIHSTKMRAPPPYCLHTLGISPATSGRVNQIETDSGKVSASDIRLSPVEHCVSFQRGYNTNNVSPNAGYSYNSDRNIRTFSDHMHILRSKSALELDSVETEYGKRDHYFFLNSEQEKDVPPFRSQTLAQYPSNEKNSEGDITTSLNTENKRGTSIRKSRSKERLHKVPNTRFDDIEKSPRKSILNHYIPSCEKSGEVIQMKRNRSQLKKTVPSASYRDYPYGFTPLDAERHVQMSVCAHNNLTNRTSHIDEPKFVSIARDKERRRQRAEYNRLRELELYFGGNSFDAIKTCNSSRDVMIKDNEVCHNENSQQHVSRYSDGSSNRTMKHSYYEKFGLRDGSPVKHGYYKVTETDSIDRGGLQLHYKERVTERVGQEPPPSIMESNFIENRLTKQTDTQSMQEITRRQKEASRRLAEDFENKFGTKKTYSKEKAINKISILPSNLKHPVETSIDDEIQFQSENKANGFILPSSCPNDQPNSFTINNDMKGQMGNLRVDNFAVEYAFNDSSESWMRQNDHKYRSEGDEHKMVWHGCMDQCLFDPEIQQIRSTTNAGISESHSTDI